MTERRRYCPRNHDTFAVGRDSSYRCLACKRESGAEARHARPAEERARQSDDIDRRLAEMQRQREIQRQRILDSGDSRAVLDLLERERPGRDLWLAPERGPAEDLRRAGHARLGVYCGIRNRLVERRNERYRNAQAVKSPP